MLEYISAIIQPCARLPEAPTSYLAHGVLEKRRRKNVKGKKGGNNREVQAA